MMDRGKAQSVRLVFYDGRNGDGDVVAEYLLHSSKYATPIIEATRELPENEPFDPGERVDLPSRTEWHISAPLMTLFMPPAGEVARLKADLGIVGNELERMRQYAEALRAGRGELEGEP